MIRHCCDNDNVDVDGWLLRAAGACKYAHRPSVVQVVRFQSLRRVSDSYELYDWRRAKFRITVFELYLYDAFSASNCAETFVRPFEQHTHTLLNGYHRTNDEQCTMYRAQQTHDESPSGECARNVIKMNKRGFGFFNRLFVYIHEQRMTVDGVYVVRFIVRCWLVPWCTHANWWPHLC